jgi:glycosyltransferase involved in cell wall biosynthesis
LVLTGANSEQVSRGVAEYKGVQLLDKKIAPKDCDIIGMGYQSNEVMDALILKARLLVSPSIYEGTCAPAMDAWSFAVPTAISDIKPFKEAELRWGVKSAFFDPMNPKNIADVIEEYLNNYEKAKQDAIISQSRMFEYTWKDVANSYMNVFKQAVEKY